MKHQRSIFNIILFTLIIALLPGCGKYSIATLPHLPKNAADYQLNTHEAQLRLKKMSKKDRNELFYGYGSRLKDTEVLHVSIKNNSSNILILSPENIDLEIVSTKQALNQLKNSTTGRVIGSGILGSVLFPLGTIVAGGAVGAASSNTNKTIEKEFNKKVLAKNMSIFPKQSRDCLILVKKNSFNSAFCINLQDDHKQTCVPFYVDLEKHINNEFIVA